MKDGDVQFQEIFKFHQLGVNAEGKAVGYHTATGVIPMRMEHLKAEGEEIPESLFTPTPQPPPDKLYCPSRRSKCRSYRLRSCSR